MFKLYFPQWNSEMRDGAACWVTIYLSKNNLEHLGQDPWSFCSQAGGSNKPKRGGNVLWSRASRVPDLLSMSSGPNNAGKKGTQGDINLKRKQQNSGKEQTGEFLRLGVARGGCTVGSFKALPDSSFALWWRHSVCLWVGMLWPLFACKCIPGSQEARH